MILKSYIVEQNIKILNDYNATLLYGVNSGIKDDIKFEIIKNKKSEEIINFFEEDILKNKDILHENFLTNSLFSQKKIINLHNVTDKIFTEISDCLEKGNKDVKIFLFSENLDKKSKLRNLFEKDKMLAIFPCYEDNERSLINYIDKELRNLKGVSGEIINLIISNSNMNRKIIQNELIKIKLFFSEKKINKEQLLEILNIKNNTSFEEIRDSALVGAKTKINKLLSEIEILHEDSFFYLNNLSYRVLKLLEIRSNQENIDNYEQVVQNLKPPIFWKDKPVYVEQLKKWNLKKLNKAVSKIDETEILMKKNSNIRNDTLIKALVVELSKEASTS